MLNYLKLPAKLKQGNEISVVESVKAAADVYSPFEGEVVAVNERVNC